MAATLVQENSIDIAAWPRDEEFGIFPQGTRAKCSVLAPAGLAEPVLRPGERYLFKLSREAYPDQFWAEVVAYRIGRLLGLDVPPAFASFDSSTNECGALIQWFYREDVDRFVHAGDYLQRLQPDFDRERGTDHNLRDNSRLLRSFSISVGMLRDWRQWWANALVFDALLGNTDRHQDNWGFIFDDGPPGEVRLAPLFDNGTSLGHERFPERVAGWDPATLDRYIAKGTHHVRWRLGDSQAERAHMTLVRNAVASWPREIAPIGRLIGRISADDLESSIDDLTRVAIPVVLSQERLRFMLRLLCRRLDHLKEIFRVASESHR